MRLVDISFSIRDIVLARAIAAYWEVASCR